MKRAVVVCGLFAAMAGGAWGQEGAAAGRWFFPRNSVRGFVDFQVAPPHNEIDLGICTLTTDNPDPRHPTCSAYARYAWSGYLELQPIGRGPLRRLFVFLEPKVYGGDTLPQERYTASASLIMWERTMGAGLELPSSFELRLTQHRTILLGRYSRPGGAATLRTDGPYGLYTTVGVRWYFGGWGHSALRAP
jgi:hypothetical protein